MIGLLDALKEVPPAARAPYQPETQDCAIARNDFVALQVAAVQAKHHGATPIGPFSFTPDGQFYVGWHNERLAAVQATAGWSRLAPTISRTGGSFFLLGLDVRLYRRRQTGRGGYYTLPVRLRISP